MKLPFITAVFLLFAFSASAQKEFIGTATYKMSVVGGDDKKADSMTIVFDKTRLLITLHMNKDEMTVIADLAAQKQYILNTQAKVYRKDTLNNKAPYNFINSEKIMLVMGGICFHYKADAAQLDKSKMVRSDCLASTDYYASTAIKNYWFFDVQPIIIDSRLVMDFIVTEPDGNKPRIFISNIVRQENVDSFFNLADYKEMK